MEFMLDSANLAELQHGCEYYPVDGITTNPSILKAEIPINYFEHLKKIQAIAGTGTFHVQLGKMTFEEMVEKTIKWVKANGGRVTATSIYYTFQGIMAIQAGADYLAPYCNRMNNNDIDFYSAISQLRQLIDRDGYDSKILAASFKSVAQVTQAIEAGAHAVTIQPALLKTAMHSALVADAVAAFGKDQAKVKGE